MILLLLLCVRVFFGGGGGWWGGGDKTRMTCFSGWVGAVGVGQREDQNDGGRGGAAERRPE